MVSFTAYRDLLRKAHWLLRAYPEVMLLADRGFACPELLAWLETRQWHNALRLKCDVQVQGPRRLPMDIGQLYPPLNETRNYRNVRLWADATHQTHRVLATVSGASESWAVITDESPSLNILWQYALRFRVEELFLESKSGAFQLEDSR
jgi:hypothetical protein